MRLSLSLLGMSNQDINEYIDAVLSKNPFLQKIYDQTKKSYTQPQSYAMEYNETINEQLENPRDTLCSQLKMLNLSADQYEIAEYIVYELDDNGFLKTELSSIGFDLSCGLEEVEEALEVVQSLDPAGIGARNVGESLSIQLERKGMKDSLEYQIISEHLLDIATSDIKKIASSLKRDEKDVEKAIKSIKSLNPRPASTILSKGATLVVADMIAQFKKNKLIIEINRASSPDLKFYNPYKNELEIVKDENARKFIKENMNAAKDLIDGLKKREETMCKVADFILTTQKDHILKNEPLKILTINDVAKKLNLHSSTISRTVSNKYVILNGKASRLDSFLCHALKSKNGESLSKNLVKKKIERLIQTEDKASPLSDNELVELLAKDGITIKRRTVAKYRDSLRILPTYLRRKKI